MKIHVITIRQAHRVVFGLFAFLSAAWPVSAADAETPNVVLIISDDQAWTDYGFMDHSFIRTPNLDRMASQGALFTRGYVPGSLCRCSLATLVTGLYPHQHGITSNDPPEGVARHSMLRLIEDSATVPGLLQQKGYVSMQTGKWWEGEYSLGGFTHGMTHGDPARGGRHGDEGLKIGRQGLDPIRQFLRKREEKPFFLWYAPFMPHRPHNPPEKILEKYMDATSSKFVARYWAMCEWFDESCGNLFDLLEEEGVASNTLVMFIADNGWIQEPEKDGFASRSKRSPYDGGLRTPVILWWPGRIPPSRDDRMLVTSLDLAPTILRACGLEPPSNMPGVDLLPFTTGGATDSRTIFGEVFTHDAVDLARPERSLLYRWAIKKSWKLIVPQDPLGTVELFDVQSDPSESRNLAEIYPDRVHAITAEIDKWWDGKSTASVSQGNSDRE